MPQGCPFVSASDQIEETCWEELWCCAESRLFDWLENQLFEARLSILFDGCCVRLEIVDMFMDAAIRYLPPDSELISSLKRRRENIFRAMTGIQSAPPWGVLTLKLELDLSAQRERDRE